MAVKTPKDPREYMAWAGYFCRPTDDGGAFATLPGWRQREIHFVLERSKAKLPWTAAEYFASGIGEVQEGVAVSLPSEVTFGCLRRAERGDEPTDSMMQELRDHTTNALMLDHCTISSEGRRLLNAKPMHGFYAYLWARVLIHKKALTSLPLPYLWELEEGIHAITGKEMNLRTRAGEQVLEWLDRQAVALAAIVA